MPSNDKLSLMSAAAGGNLAGSTTRIEITSLYTTVPVTLACSLQQLRTTMFAGGSGYTATDPITAGAASFTTLAASSTAAITGDLTVGASTFVVTAATGAVSIGGLITSTVTSGNITNASSATTASIRHNLQNTGNTTFIAIEDSTGGTYGQSAYATVIGNSSARSLVFFTNNAARVIIDATGAVTLGSSLAITGALTGVTSIAISGAATTQAAGVLSLGNTTQATVGAAGGASALPATPTGYLKTYIGATQYVIPYYAQA